MGITAHPAVLAEVQRPPVFKLVREEQLVFPSRMRLEF